MVWFLKLFWSIIQASFNCMINNFFIYLGIFVGSTLATDVFIVEYISRKTLVSYNEFLGTILGDIAILKKKHSHKTISCARVS